MGEDGTQATVDVVDVDHWVSEPALHGRASAQPVGATVATEERVRLGHRTLGTAFARIAAAALVVLANGMNTFNHGTGGENAVLIVPAVGRTIGCGQVPFG
ncbi:hypothetical protein D3C79_936400 [compost metagenome]